MSERKLLAANEKVRNLRVALDSSRVIGVAMGILMERHKISSADAIGRLQEASQSGHRKLHAVAADLVYTGQLEVHVNQPAPRPTPGGHDS